MSRQKDRKILIEIKKKYKLNNIHTNTYIQKYKYKHREDVQPHNSNEIQCKNLNANCDVIKIHVLIFTIFIVSVMC